MNKEKRAVRALLDIQVGEPEKQQVMVPRLGLTITLRELPYNKLERLRGIEDADINYLLASADAPNFRDPVWYRDHMGCPTPVDAVKALLRPGEIRAIVRRCDLLNGYGPGAVISMDQTDLQDAAIGAAMEDLEKN